MGIIHKRKLLRFAVLSLFLLVSCARKIGNSADQGLISKGKDYLSKAQFREALGVFQEASSEEPGNCDAIYGILLSNTGIGIETLNNLFGFVTSLLGNLSGTQQSPPMSILYSPMDIVTGKRVLSTQADTGPINELVQQFFIPFLGQFAQVESAVQSIESLGCTFYLDHYIVDFNLGGLLRVYVDLRGEWSIVEAKFIGAIFDLFTALDYLILSLNLDLNLDPVFNALLTFVLECSSQSDTLDALLQCIQNPGNNLLQYPLVRKLLSFAQGGDFTTTLRALGFMVDKSPSFLTWHPDRYGYFIDMGGEFASALTRFADAMRILLNRKLDAPGYDYNDDPLDDVIVFNDGQEKGKYDSGDEMWFNMYYPLDVLAESKKDNICYNICTSLLSTGPSTEKCCQQGLINQFVLPLLISPQFDSIMQILYSWSNILSGKDPDSLITMSDVNRILIITGFPDVIALKPQAWFGVDKANFITQVTPPREWLPYYSDFDNDGYADFVFENEIYDQYNKSCTSGYTKYDDCSHFPSSMSWIESPTPININIPADCVAPTDVTPLLYFAPRDPSMGGALLVNVDGLASLAPCSNSVENSIMSKYSGYVLPGPDTEGLYMFNKAFNLVFRDLFGLLTGGLFGQ